SNLLQSTSYYVRIFTADEVPNWSSISNGATSYAAASTTYIWTGGTSTDWSNGANWNPNGVPTSTSGTTLAITRNQQHLSANVSVSTLTIVSGSTLTLAGFNLTCSSITNAGVLQLKGSEFVSSAPNNVSGSTIIYNATSGTNLMFSTWTY